MSTIAKIGPAIIEAVVINMVTKPIFGSVHNQPVHENHCSFVFSFYRTYRTCGVTVARVFLAVPFELYQPDIVFGVNFCELAVGKRDFTVIAEAVFINRKLISRPVVPLDTVLVYVTELAAGIAFLDDGPAGLAGIGIEGRRVFQTMQPMRKPA